MRQIIIYTLLLLLFLSKLSAQTLIPSTISSGGNIGKSSSYIVSYTIGQTSISPSANSGNFITQTGYQQFVDSTDIVPPPVHKYNIGEIPSQLVYYKTQIEFDVYSKELGVDAILSIQPDGNQKGIVDFISGSGYFTYDPDSLDFRPFSIKFIAIKNSDTVRQNVLFNCIPYLPAEQVVFGLGDPINLPDSLSKDYIIVNSVNNPGQELFNNIQRSTRNVSVIGKTVIFEDGNVNGLYNNYNNNKDIKTLTIYAQHLSIKSPLELPQTNVIIYAENLEITSNGYIITKPETAENAKPTDNGIVGHNAGNISVYIKNKYISPGIKFFALGANGQNATGPSKSPGSGGKGGDFVSNLSLDEFVDLAGGNQGSGGNSVASKGDKGQCVLEMNSAFKWLHPFWLRMVLKYGKECYLEGDLDFAVSAIDRYTKHIDNFSSSIQWHASDLFIQTELQQISYEISSLIQRVNSNLDYFGNPAGWTPMLSFEANKIIFENEIDRSIRSMYLTYWMKNAVSTLEQKVATLSSARNELSKQLDDYIESFNFSTVLIPELESKMEEISIKTDSLQNELMLIETQLNLRAQQIVEDRHKVASWKKYTAMAGQVMQVIPVYQPALGAVGTVLVEVSKYDTDKSVLENYEYYKTQNLDKLFKDINFNGSTSGIEDFLKNIDPEQIKDSGTAKDYAENLLNLAKDGQAKYKEILGIIKNEQQVPKDEINAVLAELKAADPVYNSLADKIAVLLLQKESLVQQLLSVNDNIQKLNSEINVIMLSMDGLNKDVADAQNVLDDRVNVYLDDMDYRAKERLLKYHYYLKKSYEYRMVKPYTQSLNLQNIFDSFKNIADASNGSSILSETDFLSLRSLYYEKIAIIAKEIFDEYNQNVPELSAPLKFTLSREQLEDLDKGNPVIINLVEMGLFQPNEENVRIYDFQIHSMNVNSTGQINSQSYFDIDIAHSGISKLRKNGKAYLFRNYNNNTTNPISWGCRYFRISNSIDRIGPSFASQSLLTTMMEVKGIDRDPGNILLFSRPAAWADLIITKSTHPLSTSTMKIDSLVLELRYDFSRMPSNLVAFDFAATKNLNPIIEISKKDINDRQNGRGTFSRVFNKAPSQNLTITTQKKVGSWEFEKWTDPNGNDLGPNPLIDTSISLSLNFGASIKANYILIDPKLSVSTNLINASAIGGLYNINISNSGNGELIWRSSANADWINIITGHEGVNEGIVSIEVNENNTVENRIDTVFILSDNSSNYIEKILIFQSILSSTNNVHLNDALIYPNPTKGIIHIEHPNYLNENLELALYSMNGREYPILQNGNQIDLSSFPNGVYLLKIKNHRYNHQFKIIKME
ncbi:MAG: T9SS type A sorting domain-containing protein [Saprospiraceae bacterium]